MSVLQEEAALNYWQFKEDDKGHRRVKALGHRRSAAPQRCILQSLPAPQVLLPTQIVIENHVVVIIIILRAVFE